VLSFPGIFKLKWIPQHQWVSHSLILRTLCNAELQTFDKFSTEYHHTSSTADSSPIWVCSVWSPFFIFFFLWY
jgi:hypothetical protein